MSGFNPMTGNPVVTSIESDWERVPVAGSYTPATTTKLFIHVELTQKGVEILAFG